MTTPCTQSSRIETMEKDLNQTANLLARIDERQRGHDKLLNQILDQTKKTNGRVNKLESWKNKILGGVAVISILFGFISWTTQITINTTIKSAVENGIADFAQSAEFEQIVISIVEEAEFEIKE